MQLMVALEDFWYRHLKPAFHLIASSTACEDPSAAQGHSSDMLSNAADANAQASHKKQTQEECISSCQSIDAENEDVASLMPAEEASTIEALEDAYNAAAMSVVHVTTVPAEYFPAHVVQHEQFMAQ